MIDNWFSISIWLIQYYTLCPQAITFSHINKAMSFYLQLVQLNVGRLWDIFLFLDLIKLGTLKLLDIPDILNSLLQHVRRSTQWHKQTNCHVIWDAQKSFSPQRTVRSMFYIRSFKMSLINDQVNVLDNLSNLSIIWKYLKLFFEI